jgi:hypothetical protein
MFGNLSEKGPADFRALPLKQLNSLAPLFSIDSGFNCFLEAASFNIMIDCTFSLFLAHQPITPSFFEINNQSRLSSLGQINSLSKGETLAVTI